MASVRTLLVWALLSTLFAFPLGCSQGDDWQEPRDTSFSLIAEEDASAGSVDESRLPEDAPPPIETRSLPQVETADASACGRVGHTSTTCPSISSSVSGWPKVALDEVFDDGWQGAQGTIGGVGAGLAHSWVTLTLDPVTTGDPDLYVRKNGPVAKPEGFFDCRPWYFGDKREVCSFYLESEDDYLSWGIDIYNFGSPVPARAKVTIDVQRCAAGTVFTGAPTRSGDAPVPMTCCECASGLSELGGECCDIAPCTSGSECGSGFCVEGQCCETACNSPCATCKSPGALGQCRPRARGSAGASCGAYACNGTSVSCPTSCSGDIDCANGYFCEGGQCRSKRTDGQACTSSTQCQSGHCVDGFCCDSACTDSCNACSVAKGASVNGQCKALPAGTACGEGGNYACNLSGTCPFSCTNNADCSSAAFCNAFYCSPKKELGETCSGAAQCQSGQCVDGVCCNSACPGACDRCNLAGSIGQCSVAPAGTPGSDPDCGLYLCNGTSPHCPTSCSKDNQCVSTAACLGGVCDGTAPNGASCTADNFCTSGFCSQGVCCNAACSDGGCERCDLPGLVGTCALAPVGDEGDPSCGAYTCDGMSSACPSSCATDAHCASGFTCVGGVCEAKCEKDGDCSSDTFCDAGQCRAKSPIGATCDRAAVCESGFCADGICCESACEGQCAQCNRQGSLGSCVAVPAGEPLGVGKACTTDGSVCGGRCDGESLDCQYRPKGTLCGPASCSADIARDESRCDGAGLCASGDPRPCAPYACDAIDCKTDCLSQADCHSAAECVEGQCVGTKEMGEVCESGGECESGHCTDGVCCVSACDGPCKACNLEGSLGSCLPSQAEGCEDVEEDAFMVEDPGGCGCRVVRNEGGGGRLALAALALSVLVARRRGRGKARG